MQLTWHVPTCVNVSVCRYVTVLGAVYLRLVGKPVDVYSLLEPLYSDYRKIRKRNVIGVSPTWPPHPRLITSSVVG